MEHSTSAFRQEIERAGMGGERFAQALATQFESIEQQHKTLVGEIRAASGSRMNVVLVTLLFLSLVGITVLSIVLVRGNDGSRALAAEAERLSQATTRLNEVVQQAHVTIGRMSDTAESLKQSMVTTSSANAERIEAAARANEAAAQALRSSMGVTISLMEDLKGELGRIRNETAPTTP